MSIRIHKLAEELGLDNKEMMALLKERRIIAADVKSVSSTVDNINAEALREEFARLGMEGEVVPFISDMPAAFSAADLVVCRAGALTIAELTPEFARMTGTLRMFANLVREGKTHQIPGMIQVGKKLGNQPLDDSIMDHLKMKRISPEEAYDKCLDKKKFRPFLSTPPLDDEVAAV